MPRMRFDETFKPRGNFESIPKLKLEKDEKARIAFREEDPPTYLWVHTLNAPLIVNGKGVFKPVINDDGTEGEPRRQFEFMGYRACLGDEGILEDIGLDKDNCPICDAARDGETALAPVRRYAANVLQYKTKPGTTNVAKPFSVDVRVWMFNEKMANKLWSLARSDDGGPLDTYDLILECKTAKFQQYEVGRGVNLVWKTSEETQRIADETWEANRIEDLEQHIARTASRDALEADLDIIRSRWETANNAGAPSAVAQAEETSLASDLKSLWDEDKPAATESDGLSVFAPEQKSEKKADESNDDDVFDFDSVGI